MNTQRKLLGFFAGGVLFLAFLTLYPPRPQPVAQNAPAIVSAQEEKPLQSEIAFTVLDEGTVAPGAKSRKNYAIYTEEEMKDFWKIAHGTDGKKMPVVDFKKKYVIVVFAGTKPTAGYAIKVGHIKESGTARNVDVVISTPAKECINAETLLSPYQFIEVPYGNEASLSHTDTEVEVACKK